MTPKEGAFPVFSIRFRLAGDNHILKDLSAADFDKEYDGTDIPGFVEMRFGAHTFGFCPEGPLHPEVFGPEQVDWWLTCLLEVLYRFENGAVYGAFYLIEHINTWLEFRRNGGSVTVNLAGSADGSDSFLIWEPDHTFCPREPVDQTVACARFKEEILLFGRSFLAALHEWNPQLDHTRFVAEIAAKIDRIG